MKTRHLILLLLLGILAPQYFVAPQDDPQPTPTTETPPQPTAEIRFNVVVDSAFIRQEPHLDSEPISGAFEGDLLEGIGRNADGTWYEVSRPYSETRLGWIFNGNLATPRDKIWHLPITSTVGSTGDVPVFDTGMAAFVHSESSLRSQPSITAERVAIVPHSVTLPILARNIDGSSLQVNYNGTVGWLVSFSALTNIAIEEIPIAEGLAPPIFLKERIPYEAQIAQVNRLRDYLQGPLAEATRMADHWERLIAGEVVPCIGGQIYPLYTYTADDVRQLPELQRIVPRMNEGVVLLNSSIRQLDCGVMSFSSITNARAQAVNAAGILRNANYLVNNTEELVNERR